MNSEKARKIMAVLGVWLMLFSALMVVAGNGSADVVNTGNSFGVRIWYTSLDDATRGRAENVTFSITMRNGGGSTITNCNLSVNTTIRDADGNVVSSPLTWMNQDVNDDVSINPYGGSHEFSGFIAVIKSNAEYGTYNVTVYMTFKDGSGNNHGYEGYILFDIGPRAEVWDYASGGTSVWPGEIGHELYPGLFLSENLHDVYWNISAPDSDFRFQGDNPSVAGVYEADVSSSYVWYESFLFDVSKDKAPGVYTFPMTLEYLISGQRIRDQLSINVTVKRLGTIEMSSDVSRIDRGVSTMNITFSFTNTGNVNLTDLKVQLDDTEDYFTIPKEVIRYEGGRPIYKDDWVTIGNISVGQTVSKVIKIIIDSHLPAGEHKVLFDFMADFENGTTQSSWAWDSSPADGSSAHYMPEWWGTFMGSSWGYYPEDSETGHTGAYVMFDVVGDTFDMEMNPPWGWSVTTASLISEENTLSFNVNNNEARTYRDLSFFISTDSSSPFVSAKDETAPWSEPYNVSMLGAGGTCLISLNVKVRPGTLAGYYDVPIKVTATDVAGGNTVENEVMTHILITGSGANPVITSISAGDIKAGKTFTVTVNVENTGDDVARNLQIRLAVQNLMGSSDIALLSGAPMVDRLAPGENTTLQFTFMASSHMKGGNTYPIDATITYDNMYLGDSTTQTQQIGVQSSGGLPVDLPEILMVLLVILVLIGIIGGIMFLRGPITPKESPAMLSSPQEYESPVEDTETAPYYVESAEPPAPSPPEENETEEQGDVLQF